MALTLAEIRARLQEAEDKKGGGKGNFGDGTVYAHWNINEGDNARIRFLPDADASNNYFWVEKAMIKLPFNGVKGQADSNQVIVQVPCIEMWSDMGYCPILSEVRPWFKDPQLEDKARKYWKKRSYIMQGFVRENPLKEDKVPENPIRRFVISPQIFTLIKAALMDPEMEHLPTDYQTGLDFTVNKTSKGGYADYNTSKWSRKETPLSADEMAAIEKYGLANLAEALPKRPTTEDLEIIKEMFEASVEGKPYDPARWENHFRPNGYKSLEKNDNAEEFSKPVNLPAVPADVPTPAPVEDTPTPTPVVEEKEVSKPAAETPSTASTSKADDILTMIRNRNKAA